MTELLVGGAALAFGWLGRGFVLWHRAKRSGQDLTIVEAIRLIVTGGRG